MTSASEHLDTLIIGAGALGGLLAARLSEAGAPPVVAVRTAAAADHLRAHGLRAIWEGRDRVHRGLVVHALEALPERRRFAVVVLSTKLHDAQDIAERLPALLDRDGVIVPLQNGLFAPMLDARVPGSRVLGAVSNLAVTLVAPGHVAQGNRGQILIGEIGGGVTPRVERVVTHLARACAVEATANYAGVVWAKLSLNCSLTTLGAIAGSTMHEYLDHPAGAAAFTGLYDETIAVALAQGVRLEDLTVPARRPGSPDHPAAPAAAQAWIDAVRGFYGALRASMLQDLERGRRTEIDAQNGAVVDLGARLGVDVPLNRRAVEIVRNLEATRSAGRLDLLEALVHGS